MLKYQLGKSRGHIQRTASAKALRKKRAQGIERGQQSDQEAEKKMRQEGQLGPDLGSWRLQGAAGSHQKNTIKRFQRQMTGSNWHF